jgi:alpha-tubulin suppressor-like RCC1 family protein
MDGYEEGRFISLYILFANLKIKNIMSLLYYWGKPITKTLFQRNGNDQNVVAFDKEITQLACGENHAIVVMDRNAYGFGDNSEGQLGDSTEDGELGIRRITILNNNKIKQVSCGWNHTLILD